MSNLNKSKDFALILGGSKGIGFEVAKQMLSKNYHIILNSRNPFNAYNELKNNYEDKIILLPGDISEDSTLKNLIDILENINKLDSILINYGGPNIKPFYEVTYNEWIDYFKIMFLSPIEIIKNTIKYLKNSEYPRIVAITSFTTKKITANMIVSNSLRIALVNALKTINLELSEMFEKKILINAVAPGYINTQRLQDFISKQSQILNINEKDYIKQIEKNILVKRISEPEEIAKFIAFLLSYENTYINNQHIFFDGGIVY
ncbi:MAG: SDR family oxidoreductase [bacterium]|jgi:3-oxoacyl-[acyl-carrier protein] reductase